MKSGKQIKSRFLRLAAKQVKLNNQFVKLSPEAKTDLLGRKLLNQLTLVNQSLQELYWVMEVHNKKQKNVKKSGNK